MALFVVDEEKCNRDGICVAECPMKIIELKDKESIPEPVPWAEELCIDCGHCVAVCPYGALSHRSMAPEKCPPLIKDLVPSPEHVEHILRSRRSIRTYKDKPVERDIITKLIDIAHFAPTGHNHQQVNWMVTQDAKDVQKFAGITVDWMRFMIKEQPEMVGEMHFDLIVAGWDLGIDSVCRNAPHLIITHAPAEDPLAPSACTIALSYLDLATPSFGLGACWAGLFGGAATFWPPMQDALELPEGHICLGAMMLGYSKYKYHRLPLRNEAQVTWR